jgi:mycothiol synthase
MGPSYTVTYAQPTEQAAAFDLIFQHFPESDRSPRVANALQLVRRGELPAEGIFVARKGAALVGALVCLPLRGASALIWPPQAAGDSDLTAVEDLLMRESCAWLRGRGAKLVQALLTDDETHLASPLGRNGFNHVTNLVYLRHDLDLPPGFSRDHEKLSYLAPIGEQRLVFQQILLRSYEGTLDCPEVNGVRSIDEILEGHRGLRVDDPPTWWLALDGGRPVGVILAAEMPESAWDLSYIGVIPEARRRGLGRELVRKVLIEAKGAGASNVSLSVDTRNRPAWQLYVGMGFAACDRREVHLAIWA